MKRRNKRRRISRRLSTAPPRLSIKSDTQSLELSSNYAVNTNSFRKDVSLASIVSQPYNLGLAFAFQQARVCAAIVYWQSNNSKSDSGSVYFNVEAYGENDNPTNRGFNEAMFYPGSVVRKVWQNVSNRWFPTTPADRAYRDLYSWHGLFTIVVRHSDSKALLSGNIMCHLKLQLRGKSIRRCVKAARLLTTCGSATTDDVDEAASSSERP